MCKFFSPHQLSLRCAAFERYGIVRTYLNPIRVSATSPLSAILRLTLFSSKGKSKVRTHLNPTFISTNSQVSTTLVSLEGQKPPPRHPPTWFVHRETLRSLVRILKEVQLSLRSRGMAYPSCASAKNIRKNEKNSDNELFPHEAPVDYPEGFFTFIILC